MKTESPTDHSFVTEALHRTRRSFGYVMLFGLCGNLLMLAPSIYSMQVLDRVLSSASIPTLLNLTLIIIAALIFYSIFTMVRSMILTQTGEWLETKVSSRLLAIGITQNSLGSQTSSSQYLRDLSVIKNFITGNGISSILDAPWSIIFLLVMYMLNPIMGFVTLIGGVLLLILGILNEVMTRKPFNLATREQLKAFEIADAASRNAEAIEAMGMMPNIQNLWTQANEKSHVHQKLAYGRANMLQAISRFVRMLIQIAITGMGAWLVLQNELSSGAMIAGSILSGKALAPFETSLMIWKGFLSARDSYNRLEKGVANFPAIRGHMTLPEPEGYLALENAVFAPQGKAPIIKGISFNLQPGETLGIIGPSAAGKSTLAKMIVGVLPTTAGAVRLDGAEIFKWNREQLGRCVGYLPQNVDLFAGSIMQNIARMLPEPSHEMVLEAAQMACVHEMILRLPEGYDTIVRPGGSTLSPGQRQRIGLARALYGRPRFLVLDEPNINLDGEGESALLRALSNIRQTGTTTVVVAHRPTLVQNTDKLLIVQDGRVKEFGETRQLLSKYRAPSISEAGA